MKSIYRILIDKFKKERVDCSDFESKVKNALQNIQVDNLERDLAVGPFTLGSPKGNILTYRQKVYIVSTTLLDLSGILENPVSYEERTSIKCSTGTCFNESLEVTRRRGFARVSYYVQEDGLDIGTSYRGIPQSYQRKLKRCEQHTTLNGATSLLIDLWNK
tara:strand:+ start:298 stop:780 length:483 start_codon:yes stop_codon:yes gene_type:complete